MAATEKDRAVYIRGSWDRNNFVGRGFWVSDFIGVGAGGELNTLAKSVNRKYSITGSGEVKYLNEDVLWRKSERISETRERGMAWNVYWEKENSGAEKRVWKYLFTL